MSRPTKKLISACIAAAFIAAPLHAAQSDLDQIAGLKRGSLSVGTFPTLAGSFLPAVITVFKKRYPAIGLSVRSVSENRFTGINHDYIRDDSHAFINELLDGLTAREAKVMRMRFGLDDGRPRTLDEVGRFLGLTRERIRQIERDTLAEIRAGGRADALREYVA